MSIALAAVCALPAQASLLPFVSYNGNVALSSDGFGGSVSGNLTANAPSGSTVVAAYLYTATQNTSTVPTTVTLDGNSITFTNTSANTTACCNLRSHRADVTSIVASQINGGAGGAYDFLISEGANANSIDGSALVVVYSNPSNPDASVGILDGFANVTGDTTSINFASPLDPTDPGFFAEMRLGINFSFNSSSPIQVSDVDVNGQDLTTVAGNFDDGAGFDGGLITVGGDDDPLRGPVITDLLLDKERYDLTSFVTAGDTSITVDTFNTSKDDNIFLAMFYVSGEAGFNEPPPSANVIPLPASAWLLGAGVLGLAGLRRRRKMSIS